jgi:hypothetical protein
MRKRLNQVNYLVTRFSITAEPLFAPSLLFAVVQAERAATDATSTAAMMNFFMFLAPKNKMKKQAALKKFQVIGENDYWNFHRLTSENFKFMDFFINY